jgi:hypothetical protein
MCAVFTSETLRGMSRTINDDDQSSFVHSNHIHDIFPDSLSLDTLPLRPHCVPALDFLKPPFTRSTLNLLQRNHLHLESPLP